MNDLQICSTVSMKGGGHQGSAFYRSGNLELASDSASARATSQGEATWGGRNQRGKLVRIWRQGNWLEGTSPFPPAGGRRERERRRKRRHPHVALVLELDEGEAEGLGGDLVEDELASLDRA